MSAFEYAKRLLRPEHPELKGTVARFNDAWILATFVIVAATTYGMVERGLCSLAIIVSLYIVVQGLQGAVWHRFIRMYIFGRRSRISKSYNHFRSMLTAVLVFAEIIWSFGIAYCAVARIEGVSIGLAESLYWSFAVGVTFALWDFGEAHRYSALVAVAVFQTGVSFVLISTTLAEVVGGFRSVEEMQ
jgi:hypothetical protein